MTATLDWSAAAARCRADGSGWVLATVLGVAGSAPRDSGTKMVITADAVYDTIGGGRLELRVIERARELLAGGTAQELLPVPLGITAGQCCGGHLTVLLESFPPTTLRVVLFGAGHVGRSLAQILGGLACVVDWYDPRPDPFPESVPAHIRRHRLDDLAGAVARCGPHSHVIVMTHDHALDEDIVHAVLASDAAASVGLIGSETKARRFRRRLQDRGLDAAAIAGLRCPVGLAGVPGKEPMAVAVAVAGELLGFAAAAACETTAPALRWHELKPLTELPPELPAELSEDAAPSRPRAVK